MDSSKLPTNSLGFPIWPSYKPVGRIVHRKVETEHYRITVEQHSKNGCALVVWGKKTQLENQPLIFWFNKHDDLRLNLGECCDKALDVIIDLISLHGVLR